MNKEQLIAMGLSAEQADKVVAQQSEEMKGFVPRSRLDEEASKVTALQTQLSDRDKDIKALQSKADKGSDLEKQLSELQTKYTDAEKTYKEQMESIKLDAALDAALTSAKARDLKSVKAHIDQTKLKLKDDGSLEGLDLAELQKSKGFLFEIEQKGDEGAGFKSGKGQQGSTVTQETFRANINNVAWMQQNMEAVTKGLSDGSLSKG